MGGNEKDEQIGELTNTFLDRSKEELEDLAGKLLNAQDAERRTIARDLHDHFAQALGFVEITLAELQQKLPGKAGELQEELKKIQGQIVELSGEVRDLSHRLHPSTLDHIGLIPALRSLVEESYSHRTNQIQIDDSDFFEDGLGSEIRSTLYRITEEALRNVQRHAGSVPVIITLYRNFETVHLQVEDNGPGFSQEALRARRTFGLISMAERARLVGGALRVTSTAGKGAKLEVVIPLANHTYEARASSPGR